MAKKKAKENLPARLISDGRFQRCSVCHTSFLTESERSLSDDFANHVRRLHQPGQTAEDVNQAAAPVVGESTARS
jgi:cytochrome c-type biogenesis protein CcmH/NrfF